MPAPNLSGLSSLGLTVWACLAPAPCLAQAADALLAQFRGGVTVHTEAAVEAVPARVGLRLFLGDSLHVPPGSRAVLLFADGRLVTVSSSLSVARGPGGGASALHARAAQAAEAARRQERPRPPGGKGPPGGQQRPPRAGTRALAPAGGATVLPIRPAFTWETLTRADAYVLQLRRVDGGPPLRFDLDDEGPFALPETTAALERGETYAWVVVPAANGRGGAEERFTVLDAEGAAAVEAFRASLAGAGIDPDGDGLFLAASFYLSLELVYEAEAALARLDAVVPASEQDAVVDLMRAGVFERLGRYEEALAAYRRAAGG